MKVIFKGGSKENFLKNLQKEVEKIAAKKLKDLEDKEQNIIKK